MTDSVTHGAVRSGAPARLTTSGRLLMCAAAAGPLYVTVAGAQVAARHGFDVRRRAVSLLSNGDLGWVQIANFVVSGLLTVLGAVGMGRVLGGPERRRTLAPMLVGIYGASLVAAGVFVADPAFGFPPGTPPGPTASLSWHGAVHLVAGSVGFLAITAAGLAFARHFRASGLPGWAWYSRATGLLVLVTFAAIATGAQLATVTMAFAVAVGAAWTWLSLVSAQLVRSGVRGHAR